MVLAAMEIRVNGGTSSGVGDANTQPRLSTKSIDTWYFDDWERWRFP